MLPGFDVHRVYNSGASGGSQILSPLIEYHHDGRSLPDGRSLIDGYLILVGIVPKNRPRGAVLAVFQTEAEAIRQISDGGDLPEDTGITFRSLLRSCRYGSQILCRPARRPGPQRDHHVLPPGIQGLSARDESTEYEPYDKVNTPIVWALWDAMYRWVDEGLPMPGAPRITHDRMHPTVSPVTSTATPWEDCGLLGSMSPTRPTWHVSLPATPWHRE